MPRGKKKVEKKKSKILPYAAALLIVIVITSFLMAYLRTKQGYRFMCPDNRTTVIDPEECPKPTPEPTALPEGISNATEEQAPGHGVCPVQCDDGDSCTLDYCSEKTRYQCYHADMQPCEGNSICEKGEYPISTDCPGCDDYDHCTKDSYDYENGTCAYTSIVPCCGNGICEFPPETYPLCPTDCLQQVELLIIDYITFTYRADYYLDLRVTNSTYIVIYFKIKNMAVNDTAEVNYVEGNGFLYDPANIKLKDEHETYDYDLDSELLHDYLDTTFIPLGIRRNAALAYVVPNPPKNLRMVVEDSRGYEIESVPVPEKRLLVA